MQDDLVLEEDTAKQYEMKEGTVNVAQYEVNLDDEMLEEEHPEQNPGVNIDYNMEGEQDTEVIDEDEDILYEDDEVDEDTDITLRDQDVDQDATEIQSLAPEIKAQHDDQTLVLEPDGVHKDLSELLHPPESYAGNQQDEFENSMESNHLGKDEQEAHVDDAAEDSEKVVVENERSNLPDVVEHIPAIPAVHEGEQEQATEQRNDTTAHDSLHPVSVSYLGEEMSLFPPLHDIETNTFLLSEISLAYGPLDNLLGSCRELLAQSIADDDEVVLDIPNLGLHICEDSKYSAQLTLSQILDVYLGLANNEQIEQVEPLHCILSTRVSLASQYAYILDSAHQGKTYSQIAADHADTPEEIGEKTEHQGQIEQGPETDTEQVAQDVAEQDTAQQTSHVAPTIEEATTDHSLEIHLPQPSTDAEEPTEKQGENVAGIADQAITSARLDNPEADNSAFGTEDVKTFPPGSDGPPTTLSNEVIDTADDDEDKNMPETASSHTVGLEPSNDHEGFVDEAVESLHQDREFEQNEDLWPEQEHLGEDDSYNSDFLTNELEPEHDHISAAHEASVLDHSAELLDEFLDEEKFEDGAEGNDLAPLAVAVEDASRNTGEATQNVAEANGDTNGHLPNSTAVGTVPVNTPPTTPSKAGLGKRKVLDDDDFGLLDNDTPEPKRRRPS